MNPSLVKALLAERQQGVQLLYGVATGTNTVEVAGSSAAVQLPALLPVKSGDYVAVLAAGADRLIIGPVGSADWADYAPTLTNITIGNGTQTHQWRGLGGKTILVSNTIVFGSTTSFSGWPLIAPPAAIDTTIGLIGKFTGTDVAPGNNFGGQVTPNGTSQVGGYTLGANGLFTFASATHPFTWTTADTYRQTYLAELA
jgi:hypothetical protein